MENVCISDKYGIAIGTIDNPIRIQGIVNGVAIPISFSADGELPIVRANEVVTLTYTVSTDPTLFADKRKYAMVAVQIPAAANGLTMTPLAAESASGNVKGIPKFYDSAGTLTSFYGVTVNGGNWIVLQAEIAPIPYIGLRFSVAITGEVKVWLMG